MLLLQETPKLITPAINSLGSCGSASLEGGAAKASAGRGCDH